MSIMRVEDFNLLYGFQEVEMNNDYIIATYQLVSATKDIGKLAMAIADEQTTGTWTKVTIESSEMKKKFGAKVLNIIPIPDLSDAAAANPEKAYILTIGYPPVNFGYDVPMFLSTIMGNISASGKIKLIDVHFPKSYLDHIQGPKFGIQGLRDALGIQDRPLLNAMIKPNLGWTPDEGAALFYEASRGGIDIIKDDELMPANQPHCPLKDRVTRMMAMEKKVFEETGEHTLYAVNITDEVFRLKDNAMRALEYGANCLMINYYTCGFSAAKGIAEDKDINVPILAHIDFVGVYVASPFHGLAGNLMIGKLARMAGADFQIQGNPFGKFPVPMLHCLQIAHYSTQPLYHIKPMMPAISGGTTQTVVKDLIDVLGMDIILAAGGAVHGHPDGSRAGALAMRQAVDASMKGIPLAEYAKQHQELAKALNIWGDTTKIFDLMK